MGAAFYRITPKDGKPVEGPVQGSGGKIGGQTYGQAYHGLSQLRQAASGEYPFGGYEPKPGHVRIYPDYCAFGDGEPVDVNIIDAEVDYIETTERRRRVPA